MEKRALPQSHSQIIQNARSKVTQSYTNSISKLNDDILGMGKALSIQMFQTGESLSLNVVIALWSGKDACSEFRSSFVSDSQGLKWCLLARRNNKGDLSAFVECVSREYKTLRSYVISAAFFVLNSYSKLCCHRPGVSVKSFAVENHKFEIDLKKKPKQLASIPLQIGFDSLLSNNELKCLGAWNQDTDKVQVRLVLLITRVENTESDESEVVTLLV